MLKGPPPKHLACSTLAPGFGIASVCLYPAASQVESPLTGIDEVHVFRCRTASPPRRSKHRRIWRRSRMLTMLPLLAFGAWPAGGGPEPQHVRKGFEHSGRAANSLLLRMGTAALREQCRAARCQRIPA